MPPRLDLECVLEEECQLGLAVGNVVKLVEVGGREGPVRWECRFEGTIVTSCMVAGQTAIIPAEQTATAMLQQNQR